MTATKSRTHSFVVTVTMDKSCTRSLALREVRDNVHGNFYCTQFEDHEPGEFRIRSVRLAKKARK